ncbi:hypothetical protein SAMN05444171_4845 [Bradyrhizobium lablabi]|uniref:Uncharacterized protein n=2 Tax=Bradyrhizobium TaxID=374 RepID=A0ABY0PF93_9BRAD|nr:hypothetical protein SAMN05444163_2322 [Bradyrhizobium ottawaense]SED69559.1 hypothetical protein SAMN05444171_4845 [Bradyrhizobium lablabi]SHL66273.1 hypothetical protein SAMN05444321_3661 [Bradyrhizobium lablabi]
MHDAEKSDLAQSTEEVGEQRGLCRGGADGGKGWGKEKLTAPSD